MLTGNMVRGRLRGWKRGNLSSLTLLAGSIFVALCFWILVVRIKSIMADALYAQSSGAEASPLYGIFRAWMNDAVYKPLQEYPTPMPYNYLFYYGYGLLGRILINDWEAFPLFARFLTLAVAFGFLTVMLYYLWYQSKELEKDLWQIRSVVLLIPVVAYVGPFTSWFYLSARPDLIAAGLELTGLVLFLCWEGERRIKAIMAVTFLFWLGWSMKQPAIFVWLGVLTWLGIQRRWKEVAISMALFALLTVIPYGMFGRSYIEHTIIIPPMFPWLWEEVVRWGKDAFVIGSYVYVPALVFGTLYLIHKGQKTSTLTVLVMIFIIALIGNVLISGKVGSGRYYYFPSFLVAALFVAQYVLWRWSIFDEAKRRMSLAVLLFGFSLGICLSSLYLLLPNQLGRINLLTSQERKEARKITKAISAAAKPVFVEDAYLALPWNSGQYPSDVMNWTFYSVMQGSRFEFPLAKRIMDRYYAEAFVFDGEWSERFARSGYKRTSRVGSIIHFVRQ